MSAPVVGLAPFVSVTRYVTGLPMSTHTRLRPRPLAFLGNALIYTVVLLTLRAMWCEGRQR